MPPNIKTLSTLMPLCDKIETFIFDNALAHCSYSISLRTQIIVQRIESPIPIEFNTIPTRQIQVYEVTSGVFSQAKYSQNC